MKPLGNLLIGLLAIVSLYGCSRANSEEFIEGLKPQYSNYKLHLFYHNGETLSSNEMKEVQFFIHSNPIILDNITEMNGHPFTKQLNQKSKKLGIKTYPMYVLINKDGIIYKTPYLSEMKSFIKQELKLH